MFDLLFTNGDIVDGLGMPRYRADLGISEGRIAAMGDLSSGEATRTIDDSGRWLSPGWIDIHVRGDWSRQLPAHLPPYP